MLKSSCTWCTELGGAACPIRRTRQQEVSIASCYRFLIPGEVGVIHRAEGGFSSRKIRIELEKALRVLKHSKAFSTDKCTTKASGGLTCSFLWAGASGRQRLPVRHSPNGLVVFVTVSVSYWLWTGSLLQDGFTVTTPEVFSAAVVGAAWTNPVATELPASSHACRHNTCQPLCQSSAH